MANLHVPPGEKDVEMNPELSLHITRGHSLGIGHIFDFYWRTEDCCELLTYPSGSLSIQTI